MNTEYVIINKTELLKRIEELESKRSSVERYDSRDYSYLTAKIHQLEQVLQFSTPLIPEIEKAFDAGSDWGEDCANSVTGVGEDYINKRDYISNLKIDI